MIGYFLLPFPMRATRAPYLWVFYRWLAVLQERALFIVGNDYLRPASQFVADQRWETGAEARLVYGYELPGPNELARHEFAPLADELFDGLLAQANGNRIELFRRWLSVPIPELVTALERVLDRHPAPIECLVTWCNCPSLTVAARSRDIPVAHIEVGPLRKPLFQHTAYFDFNGVNGNTEAARRYADIAPDTSFPVSLESLRELLYRGRAFVPTDESRYGVALQVEDDTNLIAFGRGYDNQGLLLHALATLGEQERPLVRSHPGSMFALRPGIVDVDASYDSLAFLERCRQVLTTNSSVAVEALFHGVEAQQLGESAFNHVLAAAAEERRRRLVHYLLGYLVPDALIWNLDYLRFRLSKPPETSIMQRHLAALCATGQEPHD